MSERELAGRQVGAVSGKELPGDEDACSEPGMGDMWGRGAAVSQEAPVSQMGAAAPPP